MITSLDIDAKSYEPNNVFRIDDNTAIITDGKTTFGIYKDHIYKILDGETIPTFNISDIEEMELYNKLATYLREYGTPYHETDIDDKGRTIILHDKVLGYSLGEDKDQNREGFDDENLYNLDCNICDIIAPRLKRFKELEPGCPCDMSFEEWQGILDKMIWSFENYRNSDEIDENRVNEGFDLFHKYFQNPWY